MLFNTLDFAVFLLAVLSLYHALPQRAQNRLLLVASYVFYGAWDWRFLGLIWLSTLIDYSVGLGLGRTEDPRSRRRLLTVSIVANLSLLGAFKYAGFFSRSFSDLMAAFGVDVAPIVIDVVLPVGISFYTFQTLSYTIDVYRKQLEPTRRFADFALFVAFFPQLVAGPIERASALLPQIFRERRPTADQIGSGCWLILWGLYKKVVVADNLAFLVGPVYTPGYDPTGVEIVIATYAWFFQLYCDFSGYTDIARGAARLLGFELSVNFDLPALSTNIADFWQRWHISLNTWIRDYVYIPLGGSRLGPLRNASNLFIMFTLIGLWHGASWTFVLYGALNGVFMLVYRIARSASPRFVPASRVGAFAWLWLRRAFMLSLTCAAAVLFRAESIGHAGSLYARTWSAPGLGHALDWLAPLAFLLIPLLVMETWQSRSGDHEVVLRRPWPQRVAIYALVALSLIWIGEDGEIPFIYFQF